MEDSGRTHAGRARTRKLGHFKRQHGATLRRSLCKVEICVSVEKFERYDSLRISRPRDIKRTRDLTRPAPVFLLTVSFLSLEHVQPKLNTSLKTEVISLLRPRCFLSRAIPCASISNSIQRDSHVLYMRARIKHAISRCETSRGANANFDGRREREGDSS